MKEAQKYPNLYRYLNTISVTKELGTLKQPKRWVGWLLVFALYTLVLALTHSTPMGVFILCVGLLVESYVASKREGALSAPKSLGSMAVPAIVRHLLKTNQLEVKVGTEALTRLESCATYAQRANLAVANLFVSGRITKSSKDLSKQLRAAVESCFLRTLATLTPAITHGVFEPTWESVVGEEETKLKQLSEEAQRLADSMIAHQEPHDIEPLVQRLHMLQESENAIKEDRHMELGGLDETKPDSNIL